MLSIKRTLLTLSAPALTAAAPAFANPILTNGDFATGDFSGYTVNASYTGVSQNYHGFVLPNGGNFAYLGSPHADGTLTQTFADTASQAYLVNFLLASDGETTNDFNVAIDGATLFSQSNIPASGWLSYSLAFTGTGNDTLLIGERNDPGYLAIADLSVTPATAATPEPSSLVLLGTGVLGLAGAARRRLFA